MLCHFETMPNVNLQGILCVPLYQWFLRLDKDYVWQKQWCVQSLWQVRPYPVRGELRHGNQLCDNGVDRVSWANISWPPVWTLHADGDGSVQTILYRKYLTALLEMLSKTSYRDLIYIIIYNTPSFICRYTHTNDLLGAVLDKFVYSGFLFGVLIQLESIHRLIVSVNHSLIHQIQNLIISI